MTVFPILFAVAAVLPSDRMAMADRLFDRGDYASARKEYVALKGAQGIADDEILYRLAECSRLAGDTAAAKVSYSELIDKFPLSRHVDRSRLMRAVQLKGAERLSEFRLLDSDKVRPVIRAGALYHIGVENNDRDALDRCVKLDPKGPYSLYAKFHHASLIADDPDPAVRRKAIGMLVDIHCSGDKKLAREALYFAAVRSYSDKRYKEASTLFRRYMQTYPDDERSGAARSSAAWSDYLGGKYADAAALCGDGATEDTAYLLGACAYATGDRVTARKHMTAYLEKFPAGKYRSSVELPLARIDFDAAEDSKDAPKMVEAARRAFTLSKSSHDRIRLAWAYEFSRMEKEARAEYDVVAKEFPGTADALEALFRKAMIDVRAGNWSPAELALAEMLSSGKVTSRKAEALYWRGIAAVRMGHEQKGTGFLKEALAIGLSLDASREARLILADEDFKAGNVKKAAESYVELIGEGAVERMGAAKLSAVGRFLLRTDQSPKTLAAVKKCANAILTVSNDSSEWKQEAYALLGAAEEEGGEFTSAIGSYRQALAEKVVTERRRTVALNLGILLSKAGEITESDIVLNEAINLNKNDAGSRAGAYLYLAKNRQALGDADGAIRYATVVTTLFNEPEIVAEANKILEIYAQEAK